MRSLDTRVNDLERNVSNLEDRVDHCCDPWTPIGSTRSTTEAPVCPAWTLHGDPSFQPQAFQAPLNHIRQKPSELDASYANAQRRPGHRPMDPWVRFDGLQQETSAPQGVAFRDKEIADLEELMRNTQDSLRRSEEASNRKDHQLADLERRLFDCENSLATYSNALAERQADLDEAQAACQSKDAVLQSWASTYWSVQQSYLRKKTQLSAADRELRQMQIALHDAQDDRQDHMDDIVNTKENEIANLRMLCESKNAVVGQQEQVIARGVVLMEEKDDELERMSSELAALKSDLENESRMAEEKEEVIAQLRTSLNHALTPAKLRPEAGDTPISDRARRVTYSPFATSGQELHASQSTKWTPKPFKSISLPNEQRKAAIWRHGSGSAALTFGKSGWDSGSDASLNSKPRNVSSENALDRPMEKRATSRERSQSPQAHEHPSISSAAFEPMPPLPPRRPAAVTRGNTRSRSIPQHTPELPRRRLYSYVEPDEDETCAYE